MTEEKKSDIGGATWGGEYIIDLNFKSKKDTLTEWEFKDGDAQDSDADDEQAARKELLNKLHSKNKENLKTDTLKYLFNLGSRTLDDVKNDGQQFIVVNKPNGGYEIQKKKYNEKERHALSDEEIDEIVGRKSGATNKPPRPPAKFEFDSDGNLKKNGSFIKSNLKKRFIQQLHTAAEKVYGPGKVHYKWETEDGDRTKPTNRLMVNTTPWNDDDKLDTYRFDSAEYKLVDTPEEQEKLVNLISQIQKSKSQASKKTIPLGFDKETREFTLNGKPMDKEQLQAFVMGLNGNVHSGDDEEYWSHFKISIKGSKVGDIANFSLPPVQTCNKAAPCITDGCYAVKAYGLYPGTRVAQDINLALLKAGKYDQLVRELTVAIKSTFKKTVGQIKEGEKIQYFRFHVSGDVFSDEYFKAMCQVAKNNPDVGFWTYTKQYDILLRNMDQIPDNFSVLVSCWGEFRPKAFGEKYKVLEEKFPLAYLDDGSEEMKQYIDTKDGKGEPFVCPCTDYSESEVHCNKCLKCYKTKDIMVSNLIFKKH